MAGLVLLLATGAVIFLSLLVLQVMWSLTHPPRRTYAWAVARARPGDPSELDAPRGFETWPHALPRGGETTVWEIDGDVEGGPTVILTHGWGDSRLGALARVGALAPHAGRLLAWDMPGHGDAPGRCALGVPEVRDLASLMDRVKGPVILYGWSLGAGVSIAAADARVQAVIAEAPYRLAPTPARNVMALNHLPHRVNLPIAMWLLGAKLGVGPGWRGFDRAARAAEVACPLLVVHGVEDEICPVADGREIAAAAAQGELVEIEGAAHNNLWTEPAFAARCESEISRFLERVSATLRA